MNLANPGCCDAVDPHPKTVQLRCGPYTTLAWGRHAGTTLLPNRNPLPVRRLALKSK